MKGIGGKKNRSPVENFDKFDGKRFMGRDDLISFSVDIEMIVSQLEKYRDSDIDFFIPNIYTNRFNEALDILIDLVKRAQYDVVQQNVQIAIKEGNRRVKELRELLPKKRKTSKKNKKYKRKVRKNGKQLL